MSDRARAKGDASETFEAQALEIRYQFTPVLPEILQHLRASLWVTTYQAGKVLVIGAHEGRISLSHLDFEQPMGLAVDRRRIAVGGKRQIHFLDAAHETLAASPSPHDGCYAPRASIYTGNILGHELAWGNEGLWVVNTLFSCLCTLHDRYSFVPRWWPHFISELAAEDRCHLNGLALDGEAPRFVTALAETNVAGGWRPDKATSGVVIDVASQTAIARGLAMPHSPRMFQGRLWVLDSGRGALGAVDLATGRFEMVEQLPGYVRGLAFAGQFAFVGLSKIRETAVFGGLPIAESMAAREEALRCGIGVVDLVSGKTVAVFQFISGVNEIFAVEALAGVAHPKVAGSSTGETDHEVWIVPTPGQPAPTIAKSLPRFGPLEQNGASSPIGQAPMTGRSTLAELEAHLARRPLDAPRWIALGNLRQDRDDPEGALAAYKQALDADPRSVPARQNLGYLLFNQGYAKEAVAEYETLLAIDPSPLNRLLAASVLPPIYDSAEEVAAWRESQIARLRDLAAEGAKVDAAASLVPTAFFWAYQGASDLEVMKLRGRIVRGDTAPAIAPTPRADGRRRIGFLSAYFRDHTIGRLNIGRIERLDRSRFHVSVASATRQDDPLAARFRAAADRFIDLPRDVVAAKRMLRELELDVLIFADVGMDSLCSTLAFSRMASVQCATWGHPDTTGSSAIDYFLSSELLESQAADEHYSERLVRLSQLGVYYDRPESPEKKARSTWGLTESRRVYLAPHMLFKFHPQFDSLLADVLARDPEGDFVVIDSRAPQWRRRLGERWRRTLPGGLDRVRFLPQQSRRDFLDLLAAADVILDTIHFGGGNTSYEALAVGTPIVTLPGEYLRSRITAALYRKMGFEALIAGSPTHYAELAVAVAADPPFRGECREEIAKCSGILFEDPAEIAALEDWLAAVR